MSSPTSIEDSDQNPEPNHSYTMSYTRDQRSQYPRDRSQVPPHFNYYEPHQNLNDNNYDNDFMMDNDTSDYEELRKAIVKRRLSSIKRPHQPFVDVHQSVDRKSILRLPTEILLQIFHYLERKDWYSLLTSCREIADLIIEMLWFRPNMQNDSSFKKIKQVMGMDSSKTHWDYRQYIKRLNLSFMTKLVDDELLSLFVGCPKLERLTLVNCARLSKVPITNVLQGCERLQSIDLTGVSDIQDDIIDALANNCPRLQGLYAPGCGNVSETAIISLLKSCPMLKRVKFNASSNITDESILTMYENCKSLVEIDLHGCEEITDKYLKNIFAELTQLREFRISNASGITDKLFDLVPEGSILEKLRIIDITGCNAISDKLVEKLVICAPRLRNVVLSKCMQITDASLRALSQLGRSLHYIHLGHCGLITDYGVAALVRYCHRIQYIDLACCSQLTDWTLVELANLPKLRRIGLVKCSMITDSGILELVRRRGEQDCLERVHLSYCTNLNVGPIYLLLKNCPKLTHLSLTGITAFLKREITQYCRDPPPDFNEHQKSLFCVFSGHGVNQLRNYLNQVMEARTFQMDQNEMHLLFDARRRRFANGEAVENNENNNQNNNELPVNDTNNQNPVPNDNINTFLERRGGLIGLGFPNTTLNQTNNDNPHLPDGMDQEMIINREIFRELNEGNLGPVELREHFSRIIRDHQHRRLLTGQNRMRMQELPTGNRLERFENINNNNMMVDPQNAPQIEQPPMFPNDNQVFMGTQRQPHQQQQQQQMNIIDDEDIEMDTGELFPNNN